MKTLKLGAAMMVGLALSACASTPDTFSYDEPRESVKVALMPVDAEVYFVKLGATDLRADWTDQAKENFRQSMLAHLKGTGESVVDFEEFNGSVEDVEQLLLLNEQVTTEMGRHVTMLIPGQPVVPLPHKKDQNVMTYSMGPDAAALKRATGADYAAFLTNRTSVESGGSVATKLLIGGLTGYVPGLSTFRGTYVSLVDLNTGEVVWLKAAQGGLLSGKDARDPDGAARVVKNIMDAGPFTDGGDET